jgi:hypothetical protein
MAARRRLIPPFPRFAPTHSPGNQKSAADHGSIRPGESERPGLIGATTAARRRPRGRSPLGVGRCSTRTICGFRPRPA